MESIIHQLFDGEIRPLEQVCPDTEEYRENREFHAKTSELFEKQLREISGELFGRYEDLKFYKSTMWMIEMEEMFSMGLRLGLRLMGEAYGKWD